MSKNVVDRILKYNKARKPKQLKLKWQALKESPFRFFRGTCHLFYDDLPAKSFILDSPKVWICGDLHLENFGSYKGEKRVTYFDMNDFDESVQAPCLLDVVRLCTSVFLIGITLNISKANCRKLVITFLRAYAAALSAGHIKAIEQQTAKGVVKKFLEKVRLQKRKDLLKKWVQPGNKPLIICDNKKAFAPEGEEKARVKEVKKAVEAWAKKTYTQPQFFKVLDMAIRVAGTGSLGVERYIALVRGNGKPDGYYLLDIKGANKPVPVKYLRLPQPEWPNEAERLITIQKRVQAETPAFFNALKVGKQMFVMKEMQPMEDKIDFNNLGTDMPKLHLLLKDMGEIVAWNNLRSGGRQGSAIADKLVKFGHKMHRLEKGIINYAENYASRTLKYHKEFVEKGPE